SHAALAALSDQPLVVSGAFVEADVLVAHGDPEAALAVIRAALATRVHTREGLFLPELLRVRGDAFAATGDSEAARAAYAASADVAVEQGAHLFVQRSTAASHRLDARREPDTKSR